MDDLSFIRRAMEGASAFTDVPGWGLVAIGVTAIGAAYLAATRSSAGGWIGVWLTEAVLAVAIGAAAMWHKMRRRVRESDAPVLSVPARKFLFGFWPAILAGAALTFAVVDADTLWSTGSAVPPVLPGIWLLLYGVGVLTAGAFSVRAVPLMGGGFMLLGVLALFVRTLPGDVLLAVGFGVWQMGFGFWIARRHGG